MALSPDIETNDRAVADDDAATGDLRPRLVNRLGAARLLGVSLRIVDRLLADGDLRSVRLTTGTLRIPVTELDRFIERKFAEQNGEPVPEPAP